MYIWLFNMHLTDKVGESFFQYMHIAGEQVPVEQCPLAMRVFYHEKAAHDGVEREDIKEIPTLWLVYLYE